MDKKIFIAAMALCFFVLGAADFSAAQTGTGASAVPAETSSSPVLPEASPASAVGSTAAEPRMTATSTPTLRANTSPVNPKPKPQPAPPAPEPVAAPAAITPLPADAENKTDSNVLEIAGLFAAAVAASGFGIYKLQAKKKAESKAENKEKNKNENDSPRCFNAKKLMEDKLSELTDLRGRLEGMAKEKARGVLRSTVKGTVAGEALAKLEQGEKEYNRLKKLYTTCMIEVEGASVRNNIMIELHVPDFALVRDFYGKLGFIIAVEDKKGERPGYMVMKRKDPLGETIINFYGDDERVYEQAYFKSFARNTPRGYAMGLTVPVGDIAALFKQISGVLEKNIVQKLETKRDDKNMWQDFRLADPYGFYIRFTDLIDWGQ